MSAPTTRVCDWCGGTGVAEPELGIRCGTCGGTGAITGQGRGDGPDPNGLGTGGEHRVLNPGQANRGRPAGPTTHGGEALDAPGADSQRASAPAPTSLPLSSPEPGPAPHLPLAGPGSVPLPAKPRKMRSDARCVCGCALRDHDPGCVYCRPGVPHGAENCFEFRRARGARQPKTTVHERRELDGQQDQEPGAGGKGAGGLAREGEREPDREGRAAEVGSAPGIEEAGAASLRKAGEAVEQQDASGISTTGSGDPSGPGDTGRTDGVTRRPDADPTPNAVDRRDSLSPLLAAGPGSLAGLAAPPSTQERRLYLGSADIGAVVGAAGAHGSPITVFARKTGRVREVEHEAEILWIGRVLEPTIARLYAERTGREVVKAPRFAHPTEPWAAASPDYLVPSLGLNVECKATFRFGAAAWPEDAEEPPEAICAQVQWQMGVARAAGCELVATDVPRLIASGRFVIYRVAWDAALFAALLEAGRAFWRDHVETDIAPPLDGSPAAGDYLRYRYPRSRGGDLLPATGEALGLASALGVARGREKRYAREGDKAEQLLKAIVGEADGIEGLCTWRSDKKGRTDWKAAAEVLAAELGEQFGVDGRTILDEEAEKQRGAPARRFLLSKQFTQYEEEEEET